MKLFIDTANVNEIKEIAKWGVLSGVTTNPSLIAKEGRDFKQVIEEITAMVDGPISAEVLSEKAEDMIEEGKDLFKIHENIVIKVPMTDEGLKAVSEFKRLNIPTNVTLIFSAPQALLAARAGASYVSPFLGRLDDVGQNGVYLVEEIISIFERHHIKTEVIAASIRNIGHVIDSAKSGAHIATIPYTIFKQMVNHPLTDMGIKKFIEDWKSIN